jgi:hypothetical protein
MPEEVYSVYDYRGKPISADEWKIMRLVEHWQFFITPTFAKLGSHFSRVHRVENWLRRIAARYGHTSKRELIYVTRWERGEIGGRPHCHLFLGGMRNVTNYISMQWMLIHDWRKRLQSDIDVRIFERSRLNQSANYVGGDVDWEKNRYEISKFGQAYKVFFSSRAEELLLQMSKTS